MVRWCLRVNARADLGKAGKWGHVCGVRGVGRAAKKVDKVRRLVRVLMFCDVHNAFV